MANIKRQNVIKLISSYDYPAAKLLANEIKDYLTDDAMKLLNAAEGRWRLDYNCVANVLKDTDYDIIPVKKKEEREITEYLIELSQHNLPEENAQLVSILYHTINDVERIGDHAENIVELAMSKINNKIEMSDEALSEMNEIFQITLKSLDISIKSFENNKNNNDINEEIEDKIDTLEKKFRNNNIARLNAKQCYANAGVMFFDLLSNLERIGDHANNISNIKEEYTHKIYI